MKTKIMAYLLFLALFMYAGGASAFIESDDNNYFGIGAGPPGLHYGNSAFGANAGNSSDGDFNSFFGKNAGINNDGDSNSFFGNYAGSDSTGYDNTFIGAYAGRWNAGGANTFIGRSTGLNNSIGSWNTFIGNWSGYSNIDGDANIFIGYNSGYTNTSGNSNTFIGYWSGYANTSGNSNTFIGYRSGNSNTSGKENTFVGHSTGYSNDSGKWNTFLGLNSGYNNTTGSWNTFIGEGAGFSNTTGYDNTFLGEGAGFSNQTGNMNLFLGFNAGYYETGSNRLYIENSTSSSPLIYGEFDNDIVKINGKLSVGTNPTLSQLTVAGVIESTAGGIKFPDGSTIASANTINADLLDGWHASAFAQSSHSHSGVDIISGTVGEAYVDALIARDSEIMPTVLANDGNSSTLDADLLDGMDSTAFMSASTDNWVNASGDTMNGDLLVYGIVDIDEDLYVVGNIYAESDERSKTDIKPIDSSLNKINNIQGVSYAWKNEEKSNEGTHYGVIAQEVEKVLPEIVTTGANGRKKVAYMELVPVMIEAIKEQQRKFDEYVQQQLKTIELQKRIAEQQQNTITELTERLSELEREVKLKGRLASVMK